MLVGLTSCLIRCLCNTHRFRIAGIQGATDAAIVCPGSLPPGFCNQVVFGKRMRDIIKVAQVFDAGQRADQEFDQFHLGCKSTRFLINQHLYEPTDQAVLLRELTKCNKSPCSVSKLQAELRAVRLVGYAQITRTTPETKFVVQNFICFNDSGSVCAKVTLGLLSW